MNHNHHQLLQLNKDMESVGNINNSPQMSSEWKTPSVRGHVLGTSQNPVDITEDEEDKKPIINLLSRLKPFRSSNKKQVVSQNFSDESAIIIQRMKKLLISELVSANNLNMDISSMIEHANGVFDTLAFLGDDDMAFYGNIRSYIYWYNEWFVADGLRNGLCKDITDHHKKLENELKKADECVRKAESDLSVEKNKMNFIREKIRNLEQELAQSEARVITLAVEKEKSEEVRYGVNIELNSAVAKANVAWEMLNKIDDRRKAAVNGISEMTKLLKSLSV